MASFPQVHTGTHRWLLIGLVALTTACTPAAPVSPTLTSVPATPAAAAPTPLPTPPATATPLAAATATALPDLMPAPVVRAEDQALQLCSMTTI